jgi:hypothetical protein
MAAIGLLFTLYKLIGTRIFKYDAFLDALFTLGLPCLFVGSYDAVVTAIFTGIFFSFILFFMKKLRHLLAPATRDTDTWQFAGKLRKQWNEFKTNQTAKDLWEEIKR